MAVPVIMDSHRHQLCFEYFSNILLAYREALPIEHDFIRFQVIDKVTGKITSVFVNGHDLRKIGLSLTVCKALEDTPVQLSQTIRQAATYEMLLEKAASVASKHLDKEYLSLFTGNITNANRIIAANIYNKFGHSSKIIGVPGMYFDYSEPSTKIFINLKKTPYLGEGSFGKVRKVLWLTAPKKSVRLVAKKVPIDKTDKEDAASFKREIQTLKDFRNKRGIISLISGGVFNNHYAMFLPLYECNLLNFLEKHPFKLAMDQKLSLISQWLEGLQAIAEKGIHGDLSSSNLLLKRDPNGKVEGVISDFGSFRPSGKEVHGLTSVMFCSPEYFAKKKVSAKLDVWSLGISIRELFAQNYLPCWWFQTPEEMAKWLASLKSDWVLKHRTKRGTPIFVLDVINRMLNPEEDSRLTAKEAFELFSKGLSTYIFDPKSLSELSRKL